jgi:hypothetical protein
VNWRTRRAERLGADHRIDSNLSTPFVDDVDPYATHHNSNPFADDAMGYTSGYAQPRARTMSAEPTRRAPHARSGPVEMLARRR